jgi:hypothetical protein
MTDTYRKILLTDEIRGAALARAKSLPVFEGSHRKLQANIVGCIGEIVFEQFLKRNHVLFEDHRESTQRDYMISAKISLEVKTKDRTVKPAAKFDNSVPAYNHEHQRPDYYYFVSLLRARDADESDVRRFTAAFLLGGIDLLTLDREGTRWAAGQIDPSNGTKFWTACINVGMEKLLSNNAMLKIFRGET